MPMGILKAAGRQLRQRPRLREVEQTHLLKTD